MLFQCLLKSITQAPTRDDRLNMVLNRINMCLFTLSLMELLIGAPA